MKNTIIDLMEIDDMNSETSLNDSQKRIHNLFSNAIKEITGMIEFIGLLPEKE